MDFLIRIFPSIHDLILKLSGDTESFIVLTVVFADIALSVMARIRIGKEEHKSVTLLSKGLMYGAIAKMALALIPWLSWAFREFSGKQGINAGALSYFAFGWFVIQIAGEGASCFAYYTILHPEQINFVTKISKKYLKAEITRKLGKLDKEQKDLILEMLSINKEEEQNG